MIPAGRHSHVKWRPAGIRTARGEGETVGAQHGFYFDSARCTGCKTCVLACKDYKNLDVATAFRRVYDYEGGSWERNDDGTWLQNSFVYHISLACNHCGAPICVMVCPTGAMHQDGETGLASVDTHVCVGCGYCELSCPYHAPKVSGTLHQCVKCDGCHERVVQGLDPICVRACPMRALEFGTMQELEERHATEGTVRAIAPLPEDSYTLPNLIIRPCPAARPSGDTEGRIANRTEVE